MVIDPLIGQIEPFADLQLFHFFGNGRQIRRDVVLGTNLVDHLGRCRAVIRLRWLPAGGIRGTSVLGHETVRRASHGELQPRPAFRLPTGRTPFTSGWNQKQARPASKSNRVQGLENAQPSKLGSASEKTRRA